jgi:hypothetical protein
MGKVMISPSPSCGESYEFVYVYGEYYESVYVYDESYESVYVCGLSVHQKCSNYVLTNLLFGLYRSM